VGTYGKGIILLIIVLLFVTFGVENSQSVQLKYYFEGLTINSPLYAVVYVSIIIGIVVGIIMGLRSRVSMRKTVRNLQKENRELKELTSKEPGPREPEP